MANKIIIKRTNVQGRIPTVNDLDLGELAINTNDGRFFAKKNDGSASIVDLKQNDPVRILGDASSTYAWDQSTYTSNVTMTLNTVNGNVGTFGDNTNNVLTVPVITVNSKGLVTGVTTTTFSAAANLGTMAVQNANNVSIVGGSIDGVSIGLGVRSYGGFTEVNTDYSANIGGNLSVVGNATVSQNLTVSGKLFSNDITAASVTVDGDTIVTGNLTVQGVTTTVNSTTVAIGDLNIELAKDATNAAQANGAGITVIGPTTPATITYNGTNDSWNVNKKLNGVNAEFTGTLEAGTFVADTLSGEIRPNTNGANAGGIVFPANPGGGSNDIATMRYYVDNGAEGTVLEIKVANDAGGAGGIDYIRLNGSGGTKVDNTLTADNIKNNALTSGRITFATTDGLLTDDSDLTYNSTTNTVTVPNLSIGTMATLASAKVSDLTSGRMVFVSTNGQLVDNGNLTYSSATNTITVPNLEIGTNAHIVNSLTVDGQAVIGNLTITGTTNLSSIATSNAQATEVIYGGANGVLKGESSFTYAESTDTLSVGNITVADDVAVNGGDLTTTSTTFNLVNANATTVNLGGAATAVNIGAAGSSGTLTVKNDNVVLDGDLQIKGGDLTTNQTTFNLLNATATTINFGGAATAVEIGSSSGTTTINNNGQVDGTLGVTGNFAVNTNKFSVTASSGNTAVAGTIVIDGAATLQSTLDVIGATTFANVVSLITANAQATLGNYSTGSLRILGDESVNGKLQVSGAIYKGGFEVINTQDTIDGGTF